MKKLLITACGLLAASVIAVNAQDATTNAPVKAKLTAEQRAERKALVEKYDTNKDGKLTKDEISKMTDADKAKWDKLTPAHQGAKKKKAADETNQ